MDSITEDPRKRPRRRRHPGWVSEAVRAIQEGHRVEAHFELLFRTYEPAIRRKLRYRGWDGADLDEVVQDVMLRVYRGVGTFRLDASFDTWILRIMSNADSNARRDRQTAKARATQTSLDELLEADPERGPALPEPETSEPSPLDATLAAERKAKLVAALDQLPTRIRQCLLFRYQGYRYREIAVAQGVSVDTVKKQIVQGHKRLRPILGPWVELFGLVLSLLLLLACK